MDLSTLGSRIKHSWNVFVGRDQAPMFNVDGGYVRRPDRLRLTRGNERSIITAIYNRIAADVAAVDIRHVRLDENDRFFEEIKSGLNTCLSLSANLDQTGRAFIMDAALSLLDEGCVALVPIITDDDPNRPGAQAGSFDILSIRTAKILTWYPDRISVNVYDERIGQKKQITIPKRMTAIVENPFYAVMNELKSTMQRLMRNLLLLDVVDEASNSGKLDLIIQLPYVVKGERRKEQAEIRRQEVEDQLKNSKYGVAYTDGTERVIQLNRPVDNSLLKQVEYLTSMLYSQLGITQEIMNGTADDKTMLNYYTRIIEPILSAIVDEMRRKFLTETARTQHQSIMFFRDPFKLVPVNDLAEIADKMTRNEIMSSNEIRQIIGLKPSKDPRADELHNSNMPSEDRLPLSEYEEEDNQNEV